MVRRIIQEDATGCGIACAAMLAGISYSRAKTVALRLGIIGQKPPYYTNASDLSKLLRELELVPSRGRKLSKWPSLHSLSIVGVNFSEATGNWHWVVYVPSAAGGHVLDPRATVKTQLRTDWARLRPRSYIPVLQPNISSKRTGGKASPAA